MNCPILHSAAEARNRGISSIPSFPLPPCSDLLFSLAHFYLIHFSRCSLNSVTHTTKLNQLAITLHLDCGTTLHLIFWNYSCFSTWCSESNLDHAPSLLKHIHGFSQLCWTNKHLSCSPQNPTWAWPLCLFKLLLHPFYFFPVHQSHWLSSFSWIPCFDLSQDLCTRSLWLPDYHSIIPFT